jgi:hypothetical protein
MSVPVSPSKRVVQGGLWLLVCLVMFQVYDRVKLSMSGAPRAALEQLAACAEARSLLGEPIDASWWGWSHGSLRVPQHSQVWLAASGRVDWRMPVAGADGRGVLHFQGEKVQGFWKLETVLEAGGTTVHTRGCAVR